jgi:hypothetical protein
MKLTIQIDPPANAGKAYTSLEVVRGSVLLDVSHAQPISKIVVSLQGQCLPFSRLLYLHCFQVDCIRL